MPHPKRSNSTRRPYRKPPNGTIVLPSGPQPSDILLLGEAPGEAEALGGAPFIGPSGVQNDWYLSLFKLHSHDFRKSNTFWEYYDKNPDPSDADIDRYRPLVIQDIWATRPRLIIALGAFAMRFLLGSKASLDACHGLVHNPGHFDPLLAPQCPPETKIIVGHHPAYGLHQPAMKPIIYGDYEAISRAIKLVRSGISPTPHPYDPLSGKELYLDVTGRELSQIIHANRSRIRTLGLDTEGSPWSVQVSFDDGIAYCLRACQPDLSIGISALQELVLDPKVLTITHCASTPDGTMIDISVCAKMGLDLRRANLFDTMYAAYLRRTIFKGLKPISYRYSSGLMDDYMSLVRGAAKPLQAEYYHTITKHNWPIIPRHVVEKNDGTWRLYKPKPLNGIVKGILHRFETNKLDKDGNPIDLEKAWKDLLPQYKQFAEDKLGPFPFSSLDHIPLEKAISYSCADADFTRRNLPNLLKDLEDHSLTQINREGQYLLPMWYSAQSRGMPAKKDKVESLIKKMNRICDETRAEISTVYFGGKPINPKSPPQVVKLIKHLGIDTSKLKRSKETGEISSAKDSIEHLRWEHPAIDLVFKYREAQHYRDSFGKGYLEQFQKGEEFHWVKTVLDPAKIETRRLSSSKPNLLNVPSKTELSKLVRGCFVAPEGFKFVSVDFSQIELRVMAHLSRDPIMTRIFLEGRDPHKEWTKFLFQKDDVTELERKFGKTIQFAMGYGRSPVSILQDLWQRGQMQWTLEPVVDARKAWFKRYAGVTAYRDRLIEEVRKSIVVHDQGGMPRYLPNIRSYKKYEREEAERQIFSHDIQGTAQTIIQRAMCYLRPIFESFEDNDIPIYLLLQIHDELLMLAQDDYVELAGTVVRDAFQNHCGMSLSVPIVSDVSVGQSWDTA